MKDNEFMSRKIAMCHSIKTAREIEMATCLETTYTIPKMFVFELVILTA